MRTAEVRWPRAKTVDIVIDSTGLKFHGAGEWSRARPGESRRSWRKLHISVNADDNQIIAFELTDDDTSDAAMISNLVTASAATSRSSPMEPMMASQHTTPFERRDHRIAAKIVIPPKAPSIPDKGDPHGGSERKRHAAEIARHGRMAWQRRHGYGKRSLAETAFSRIKTINNGRFTSRTFGPSRTRSPSTSRSPTETC